MGKKRRVKKLNSTAAKFYNFSGYHKKKVDSKYTQVKPIKEQSREQMKSANSFKRRNEERD